MRKDAEQTDCVLLDHGEWGWEMQVLRNGEWYYGRWWTLRAEALAEADDKRRELLREGPHQSRCACQRARRLSAKLCLLFLVMSPGGSHLLQRKAGVPLDPHPHVLGKALLRKYARA
jgi:hypothetical protein